MGRGKEILHKLMEMMEGWKRCAIIFVDDFRDEWLVCLFEVCAFCAEHMEIPAG